MTHELKILSEYYEAVVKRKKTFGMIDAEARRYRIQNLAYNDWNQGTETTWANAFSEVADTVYEPPTADVVEVPRWTSVDERLPEPNQLVGKTRKYYLVQDEYGDMLTASYNKRADGFIYWEQMYDIEPLHYEVVAWMELPEPYRKETEDGAKN